MAHGSDPSLCPMPSLPAALPSLLLAHNAECSPDSDEHLQLFAMRAQPEEEPFTEEVYEAWIHPCTGERAESSVERRRQMGHAFVGEIE